MFWIIMFFLSRPVPVLLEREHLVSYIRYKYIEVHLCIILCSFMPKRPRCLLNRMCFFVFLTLLPFFSLRAKKAAAKN
jgi:hypothetical protein